MTREEAVRKISHLCVSHDLPHALEALGLIKFDQQKSAKDKLLDAWPRARQLGVEPHPMYSGDLLTLLDRLNLEIVEKSPAKIDLSSVEKRNAFYGSERYRNMTTAEKCAVQGDGSINDYD